jgi:hypothetical protein
VWDSRNQAPFHTQFFAWLQEHPEERARVFPKWSLKLGASVSIWPYGVASQVDTSTGEWGFGKTLSAQQLWGVSIDVELSRKLSVADPRVELAVGANKHMSVGSLWDLNEGGRTSWAGLALHGGLGYGLPINLTIPIPKYAPPVRWRPLDAKRSWHKLRLLALLFGIVSILVGVLHIVGSILGWRVFTDPPDEWSRLSLQSIVKMIFGPEVLRPFNYVIGVLWIAAGIGTLVSLARGTLRFR